MDESFKTRCPHFQLYAAPLNIVNGPNLLTVRRCLLTERLAELLKKTGNSAMLTQRLMVRISSEKDIAFVGPDLEAVTQNSCSMLRCEEQCTPSYTAHLEYFDCADPCLDEVTCRKETEEGDADRTDSEAVPTPCGQG